MNKSGIYYPELDSLRFFAFLLVLVHHSPYMKSVVIWRTISKYGWMGVDLFLCLSAFLFAKLLYTEYQKQGDINIGYFYLRRALRIWPLYLFFFAAMFTLSIQQDDWSPNILRRSIGMLTFTDNIFVAFFHYNSAVWFSKHLWTISYEEQFYLVIPWVLRKLYQLKTQLIIMLLLGAMLIGTMIRAIFIHNQIAHPDIWVLPITHFESIFAGLVIGLGVFDKSLKKIPGWILLLIGILALYQVTQLPNLNEIQWQLMLTYPLVGIGTALILFAVINSNLWILSTFLKNALLGYLGKISYGLYVYHVLCLWITKKITKVFISPERLLVYPATVLLLALIFTIIFSVLSYQFLERPFLKLKEKFTFIKSRPI
jgi:peptidoglycan/LPS O-acetylase OafA/YrhL